MDLIVIGGGLFGSMIARYFEHKGAEVIVLDSDEKLSASKCSLGVWRDSWVEKIKVQSENSLEIWDEVGIVPDEVDFFDMDKEEEFKMKWVDFSKISMRPVPFKVHSVKNNRVKGYYFEDGDQMELKAKNVVIAAGVYTDFILNNSNYPTIGLDGYWGANFVVNMNIDVSRISTWAPYKQNVLHKIDDDHFTFSDGVKIKNPTLDDKRIKKVSPRIKTHLDEIVMANVDPEKIVQVREGLRPFLPKGLMSFVNKHDKNLFSATGGAKNGTVLCGHVAKELYQQIYL